MLNAPCFLLKKTIEDLRYEVIYLIFPMFLEHTTLLTSFFHGAIGFYVSHCIMFLFVII